MRHIEILKGLNACKEAIEWVKTQKDIKTAWLNCERGDWLLWIIKKLNYDDESKLRLIAVKCAREVQHLMRDRRSIKSLDVAESYDVAELKLEELKVAAYDADAAAKAARAAARAAYYAANAAYEAAKAAYAANAAAASAAPRKKQADIIRSFIQWNEIKNLIEK